VYYPSVCIFIRTNLLMMLCKSSHYEDFFLPFVVSFFERDMLLLCALLFLFVKREHRRTGFHPVWWSFPFPWRVWAHVYHLILFSLCLTFSVFPYLLLWHFLFLAFFSFEVFVFTFLIPSFTYMRDWRLCILFLCFYWLA